MCAFLPSFDADVRLSPAVLGPPPLFDPGNALYGLPFLWLSLLVRREGKKAFFPRLFLEKEGLTRSFRFGIIFFYSLYFFSEAEHFSHNSPQS